MTTAHKKGFTLIELLIVIGILAILLAITLVALNPAKQFAQANDTKRRSDVNAILNAVHQYSADHKGLLTGIATSGAVDSTNRTISSTVSATTVDICAAIVPTYMAALPVDPQVNNGTPVADCTQAYDTGYTITQINANNRLTIAAPGAEGPDPISVTR